MDLHKRTTILYLVLLIVFCETTAAVTSAVTNEPKSTESVTNPVSSSTNNPVSVSSSASVTNQVTISSSNPASASNSVSVTNTVSSSRNSSVSTSRPASVTSNGNTGTNSGSASGGVLSNFFGNLQNALFQSNFGNTIQKQIANFLKTNNVSLPLSIMTSPNLQNVLQLLRPGSSNSSSSSGLQGISQYVGMFGNISNTIQNATEELEQQLSPQCFSDLQYMVSELMKREQWAMKMVDATGKIPSGFMQGNFMWAGSFDECLSVRAGKFDGQYCKATLSLSSILGSLVPLPTGINVQMGICVPDSCTVHETNVTLNGLLGLVPLGKNKLETSNMECSEPPEYDDLAIAGFTVCGAFLALMVLSTLFDVMYTHHQTRSNETAPTKSIYQLNGDIEKPKSGIHINGDIDTMPTESKNHTNGNIETESKYHVNGDIGKPRKPKQPGVLAKLALAFSVYTNGRKLMSTDQAGGALGAVNGIRFLSISWVVLGHAFSSGLNNMQNPNFMQDFMKNWTSMVLVNGLLSVDTFFTLSGLLVSYLFMKEMKREKGRINWFMFYFHRFWRLTPAYMLVLLVDISLIRYLGDGPFWMKDGFEEHFCKDTWWTNLVYINNIYKRKHMCMGWSWYLANDMQFYVVSPLLLVPLYFSKKIGLFVTSLALLAITIVTGVVSGHYELSSSMFNADLSVMMIDWNHYFFDYYIVPWCRMGPYIVGIVTGYILYRTNCQYKIPKAINVVIWIFMALLACLVVYGINDPVNGHTWSNGVNALYNAVHRSVWGVCVSWVIFACVTGNGGIVNDLLSWKLFVPLGRLSYCIYLTHLLVITVYLSSLRLPMYATTLELTFVFLGSLVISVLVAIVTSLAFEAPMMAIEKAIFRRGKK